jgi:hypothetical protein
MESSSSNAGRSKRAVASVEVTSEWERQLQQLLAAHTGRGRMGPVVRTAASTRWPQPAAGTPLLQQQCMLAAHAVTGTANVPLHASV